MTRLILAGLLCGLLGALMGIALARFLNLTQSEIYFSLVGTITISSVGWYTLRALSSHD